MHHDSAPTACSRREVLTAAAAGLTAGVFGSQSALAADPPQRTGKPYMKLSLAGYSFNRMLPRGVKSSELEDGKMTLDDFVDFCAAQNLDGTELTAYYFPSDVDRHYLLHLKEKTFRLGLDISGTAIGNDFCVAPGPQRDAQLKSAAEWIERAAIMGAPVIRIFAGKVPQGDSEPAALARCIEGINESLEVAAHHGVFLALENHGGITSTPEQLLAIVKEVKHSPWFGVNFDSGNFRTATPYADLEKIAPYAINAQIKAAIAPDGNKQPADYKRLIGILRDSGYRGYVVLEYEERTDPFTEIPKHLDRLRELIHG